MGNQPAPRPCLYTLLLISYSPCHLHLNSSAFFFGQIVLQSLSETLVGGAAPVAASQLIVPLAA